MPFRVLCCAVQSPSDRSLSAWENASIGFCSGLTSKFLAMPFDVIKKRVQVSRFAWEQSIAALPSASASASAAVTASTASASADAQAAQALARTVQKSRSQLVVSEAAELGVWRCAQVIVRDEGWRALWKGTVPSLLKAGPTAAVTWATYEACDTAIRTYRARRSH